jgi:hypothetical protein
LGMILRTYDGNDVNGDVSNYSRCRVLDHCDNTGLEIIHILQILQKAVEPIIAVPSTELAIRRDQVRHCTQDRHFAVSHNPSPFYMTISVLHRPISSVEEDNPRRNAFERMLLFALFMKRKKKKRKGKKFSTERVLCSV